MRRFLGGKADGITAETPVAVDHGAHFDFPLAVELVHCHTANARRLAEAGATPWLAGAEPRVRACVAR
jgi:hypothetical protein